MRLQMVFGLSCSLLFFYKSAKLWTFLEYLLLFCFYSCWLEFDTEMNEFMDISSEVLLSAFYPADFIVVFYIFMKLNRQFDKWTLSICNRLNDIFQPNSALTEIEMIQKKRNYFIFDPKMKVPLKKSRFLELSSTIRILYKFV